MNNTRWWSSKKEKSPSYRNVPKRQSSPAHPVWLIGDDWEAQSKKQHSNVKQDQKILKFWWQFCPETTFTIKNVFKTEHAEIHTGIFSDTVFSLWTKHFLFFSYAKVSSPDETNHLPTSCYIFILRVIQLAVLRCLSSGSGFKSAGRDKALQKAHCWQNVN